jgi:hypothetical protein
MVPARLRAHMLLMKPMVLAAAGVVALVVAVAPVSAVSNVVLGTPAMASNSNCNDQPNMSAALTQLRGARASLGNAEHNKGGWRDNAIKATDDAIREASRGCDMPADR